MPLCAGNRVGPYEIVSLLGAGGMGEVYTARDTRLDRSVAIKVLPDHIAAREDLRARMEREARAVASLNHPHICTLYDIGDHEGAGYMVMELLEGETLAARLERGPIAAGQALTYAMQLADALDRAHRAGVTHRDVKPQNIVLTRDGVKVLDFGLAKSALAKAAPSEATLTRALTAEGTVLGTPQYMAPEQFEGREADPRSDIWAFGAVLYEMLTGQKAFQGKNYSTLVGSILASEPPPMSTHGIAPAWLDRVVRRCLAKDADDRWQSMRDVLLELRTPPEQAAAAAAIKPNRWPWLVAAAGALIAMISAGLLWKQGFRSADAGPMEFEIHVPGGSRTVSVSPNGKLLAWRDDNRLGLWIRSIDSNKPRLVEQSNPLSMSWSPDSKFLAYRGENDLRKFEAATWSTQVVVAGAGTQYGTAWMPDGNILMGSARGPLKKVRSTGGQPQPVFELDTRSGEMAQRFPVVLPGGKQVLYLSTHTDLNDGIYLAQLDGPANPRRVYRSAAFSYVHPNTLLVSDGGRLMAMTLNIRSGEVGEPAMLSDEATSFSASADGRVLAHIGGRAVPEQLVLYDRSGAKLDTIGAAAPWMNAHVEFSPDGRRLLFERDTNNNVDLWTVELSRKVVSRLTFGELSDGPGVWSADGQKIFFRANRPNTGPGIYEIAANGTGTEKLLHKTSTHHMHASPDGAHLLFEGGSSGNGIASLELRNGNKAGVYLPPPASGPQFSPDSRLVAYESTETGKSEIYVQTFPPGGGKWQISTTGGIEARWRGDGKEIFYDKGDGTVVAAAVDYRGGSLVVTSTRELFRFRRGRSSGTALAVTPDGKLFAIRETPPGGEAAVLLKLNWRLPGR